MRFIAPYLRILFLLVLAAACTKNKDEQVEPVSWLATINSPTGEIIEGSKAGTYSIKLMYPVTEKVPMVTLFSDRPHRLVKQIPAAEFVRSWESDFKDSPPNANLQFVAKETKEVISYIVRLTRPSYFIQGKQVVLSFEIEGNDKDKQIVIEKNVSVVSLFIDGFFSDIAGIAEGSWDAVKGAAESLGHDLEDIAEDEFKGLVAAINEVGDVLQDAEEDVAKVGEKIAKVGNLIKKALPVIAKDIEKGAEVAGDEIKKLANEFKCWGIAIGNDVLEVTVDVADAIETEGADDIGWKIYVASLHAASADVLTEFVETVLDKLGASDNVSTCAGELVPPILDIALESLDMNSFLIYLTQQIEEYKVGCGSIFDSCPNLF